MAQIQYSIVASSDVLLVESNMQSNAEKYVRACRKILKKISRGELRRPDGMATLLSGSYAYNYIHGCEPEDDIPKLEPLIFLCVTEALPYAATPSETREAAFGFLADIRRSFLEQFRGDLDILCNTVSHKFSDTSSVSSITSNTTNTIKLDDEMKSDLRRFGSFMKDKMISFGDDNNKDDYETKENELYNENRPNSFQTDGRIDLTTGPPTSTNPIYHSSSGSKIGRIISQIEQVKETVKDNIDIVIDRGENLALLHEKAENMNEQSLTFRDRSRSVRNRYCRQLYQQRIIMALIAVLVLYLISAMICGWGWDSC